MFDSYHIRSGPAQVYHSSTVTEYRAPTDESVRLLREMEDRALANVLEKFPLKNTFVDATVFKMVSHGGFSTSFIIRYKLNGHVREMRTEIPDGYDYDRKKDHHARLEILWKALAEDIAELLIKDHCKTLSKFEEPT